MRTVRFRYALSVSVAAAMLTACGGSTAAIGAPSTPTQDRSIATGAGLGASWPLRPRGERLLYLPNVQLGEVAVYTYHGDWTKTLTVKEPLGACVDKAANVWIVSARRSEIVEYAHGATQTKRILSDANQLPVHCATASTTGNLAVANIASKQPRAGSVSIFINARGTPMVYADPAMPHPRFVSYDGTGDLFVAGENSEHRLAYAELRKGSTKFINLVLSKAIKTSNGIQWDGRYIAIGSGLNIYQTVGARVVGATRLNAECNSAFFIQGGNVFVLCDIGQRVEVFRYPSGGDVVKTIDVNQLRLGLMTGVVVSR